MSDATVPPTPPPIPLPAGQPADPETRIAELATGFALGDLSEDELRELHGRLADPQAGLAAARTAWRTLETVTDLRAERSTALQDTVRSRVAGSAGGGVAARFLRRFGLRRGLAPVADAGGVDLPAGPHPAWWVAGAALLLAAALAGGWWLGHQPPVARVVAVVGRATVAGAPLGPGDPLDGSPLSLAAGATLTLRWDDGNRAVLHGPGTLSPLPRGCALLGGALWVDAVAPLAIGLPDGQAHAAAGTRFAAEVGDGRSCLATRGGSLDTGDGPLGPGLARAAGVTFPWTRVTLSALPATVPAAPVPRWHLTLRATPVGDSRLTLAWTGGGLAIDADGVTLLRADAGAIRTVHPPADSAVELDATPGGWTVRLLDEDLLRAPVAPTALTTRVSGQVGIQAVLTCGPLVEEPAAE